MGNDEFLKGVHHIRSDIKLRQHFRKRSFWSGSCLLNQELIKMLSLIEPFVLVVTRNHEGECLAMSL